MSYIENPKTAGSGVIGAIPHAGLCPNGCKDCFFNRADGYLHPLSENLPNMPTPDQAEGRVVRVNDGHDSNIDREMVMEACRPYAQKFYNTSIPRDLGGFDAPVVLTVNPGAKTDKGWHRIDPIPPNLMFVRVRTNMWNLWLVDEVVDYYTERGVSVVLTFMAYFEQPIPVEHKLNYISRTRTINRYMAITTDAWRWVMKRYEDNVLVYSCGKIEGERGTTKCRYCGNCVREFHSAQERLARLV